MYNEVREGDSNAIADATSGIYEKHYTIGPSDVVLDLGAHVGAFTLEVSKRCLRVISFEPEPFNYRKLMKNIRCGDERLNVTAVNAAAGAVDSDGVLFINRDNSGAHSLFKNDQHGPAVEVKILDIGKFLVERGLRPSFAKIDTEGSEFNILYSLREYGFKFPMAIEMHSEELYYACKGVLEHRQGGYILEPREPHVGVCYAVLR